MDFKFLSTGSGAKPIEEWPIGGALVTFKSHFAYINQNLWKCSTHPTDKEYLILKLLSACKIHLRTTERWPCASNTVGISESGTSLSVRLKRWPCSKRPVPACTDMLREELRENQTDFSNVGCLSTQTFLCVAYLQRCWYVYMNIHCVICFQTFRYRFLYFLYVQSEYSARFLCGHPLTDSLITKLSPTNSTNPIS